MTYGWEDTNHDWVHIGNFQTFDYIHRIHFPFGLYKCENCSQYMKAETDENKDLYETQRCSNLEPKPASELVDFLKNQVTVESTLSNTGWDATASEVIGGRHLD